MLKWSPNQTGNKPRPGFFLDTVTVGCALFHRQSFQEDLTIPFLSTVHKKYMDVHGKAGSSPETPAVLFFTNK